MNDYADRIKKAIENSGKTQGGIARESGITQPSLSALTKKPKRVSSANDKIALACGVNSHWLATGYGKMLGEKETIVDNSDDKEEKEILKLYRLLSPKQKAILNAVAQELARTKASKIKTAQRKKKSA